MPKESTGSHVALIASEEKRLTKPLSRHVFRFHIQQRPVRKHRRILYEPQSKVGSCHKMQSRDTFPATEELISCSEQAERARKRLRGLSGQAATQGRLGKDKESS